MSLLSSKKRLAVKIAFYAFLVSVAWALLSTGVLLAFEAQAGKKGIEARITELGEVQTPSLSRALWSFNTPLVQAQLNGLTQFPFIARADIITSDGHLLESTQSRKTQNGYRTFSLVYTDRGEPFSLGSLNLYPDYKSLHNEMMSIGFKVFVTQTINAIAIALLVITFFYGFAGRHLASISRQAEKLTMKTLDVPIVLDRQRLGAGHQDELDILQNSLNGMRLDLKNTVEELHESEKRLNLALDAVSDAVWDWRVDSNKVFFSPRWYTMLGYEPDEFPQEFKTWQLLIHPDDLLEAEKMVEKHLHSATPYQIEFRMRTKDGGWCWILARGKTVEIAPSGKAKRMVGTHVDITERKLSEELLRKERDMMRKIMETNPAGIIVTSKDGVLDYTNSQAGKILGFETSSLIKRTYNDPAWNITDTNGNPLPNEELPFQLVKRTMQPVFGIEHTIRGSSGKHIMLSINAAPILNASGRFDGIVATLEDITLRKKIEKELIEAKDAAENANRAKSVFLANMSHELRTPLNGIMGMLQLLGTTSQDIEQSELTNMALNAGTRLTNLLSDILDMSRIEADKMDIREENFEIKDTIQAVEQIFKPAANQSEIELIFKIDPKIPTTLMGDAARIQQILNNLVGNALKFTPQGAITVEATALPPLEHGEQKILFSVTDTGIGIKDDRVGELFDPFTQAEGSFKRQFQGAGLGLSIVKRLILLMDGTACIDSEVGKGTTFHVCIPFKNPDLLIETHSKTIPPDHSPEKKPSILLAEDDEMSRFVVVRRLEKSGFEVQATEDGTKIIQALRKRQFDLILMDIQMPIMDGVEAARAIRKGEAGPDKANIPIIALTAYAMSGDKEKFLEAGMNDYVSKPIELDELNKAIARVLS